jgi:hypothetical protein
MVAVNGDADGASAAAAKRARRRAAAAGRSFGAIAWGWLVRTWRL